MITIRLLRIAGIEEAFAATRLSFNGSSGTFEQSLALLSRLVERGDEEAKSMRGVVAWVEIDAPRFFWQEFVTYRIGCEQLGSESTMHGQEMRFDESTPQASIDAISKVSDIAVKKASYPDGLMQKRMFLISYQTFRRMYKQRLDHRLPHWRQFCKFIEDLPWADKLITVGLKSNH